jgi:hypothetical protein
MKKCSFPEYAKNIEQACADGQTVNKTCDDSTKKKFLTDSH